MDTSNQDSLTPKLYALTLRLQNSLCVWQLWSPETMGTEPHESMVVPLAWVYLVLGPALRDMGTARPNHAE